MSKSYKVTVHSDTGIAMTRVVDVYITANQVDLAALLLSFELSPIVTQFSVYSVVSFSAGQTGHRLSETDLGFDHIMTKMR